MAVRKFTNIPSRAEDPTWEFVGGGGNIVADPYSAPQDVYGYAAPPARPAAPVWGAPAAPAPAPAPAAQGTRAGLVSGGSDFAGMGIQKSGAIGVAQKYTPTAGLAAGGAGGGFQPRTPTGTTTTQRTVFEGEMPSLELRKMDKRRVAALRQKAMAPRLRLLRSALSRALTQSYENPNVRRMIVSGALLSYGQGIEEAGAGAEQFALQEEAAERATENQELVAAYSAAMEKYRASGRTITEQRNIYGAAGDVGIAGTPTTQVKGVGRASLLGATSKPTVWGTSRVV